MYDISEAIQNLQHALQLTPDGAAGLLNNLGTSFSIRFEHTGDLHDLSEGIRHQQRAVRFLPDGHVKLPGMLGNLGTSLSLRFAHTGEIHDISEAIGHQHHAVQLTPDGNDRLPMRLDNLGTSFRHRFERNRDMHDILEAIKYQQRAVDFTPDCHADLPRRLSSLGNSFIRRFEHTRDYKFLFPAASNFRLSATSTAGVPLVRLRAAETWVMILEQPHFSSSETELLEAHARIIQLLFLISGVENTIQRRHETLVGASQLSLAASAAALSLGHPDKALEWLVEGRCIVWNQINQLRTPIDELRSYDPALADRLSNLSRELENAGLRTDLRSKQTGLSMDDKISLEDEARTHLKHARDWEKHLNTIRNIPQFKDFLRPRKCADIMDNLPEEGPVVIINIHSNHCGALALIAGAGGPLHIPLPNFSYREAERLANGLHDFLLSLGVRSPRAMQCFNDSPVSSVDFPAVLKVLWSDVVRPILDALSFSVCFPSSFQP